MKKPPKDVIRFPDWAKAKPKPRVHRMTELDSAECRRRSEYPSKEEAVRDAWLIEQGYFRRREPHYHGVPSLDQMTPEELDLVYMTFGHGSTPTRDVAAALIGDKRPNYTKIARYIGLYALNRRVALRLRAEGNPRAQGYFDICDQIYSGIPDDLKWERA